jgi:phosphoribosyl 1,2-cyclic phosphodiesterase
VKVEIWGCRGSLASPGPDTVRYGGNTSCVSVTLNDGTTVVLDAGSGIRELGRRLGPRPAGPVHILLTHLHLDHLQGLAFFEPLWEKDVELHIWGPASASHPLADRIARYLGPPLFPIHLTDVPSTITFHDAVDDVVEIGSGRVRAESVPHQGPTVGYRVEDGGRSVAYLPDHEPSLGIDLGTLDVSWLSGYDLIDGVDVCFHDAQYFDEEYAEHLGWGHSSVTHTVTMGRRANVGQLVLFHHDPAHTDDDLERLLERAVALWGGAPGPPILAFEGMVFVLEPDEGELSRPSAVRSTRPEPPDDPG